MNTILILFLIGIIFLVFEVITPGAVLGILGGLAMTAGCVMSYMKFGAMGGLIATVTALGILCLALYLELIVLPRTKFGKRMIVQSVNEATSQPPVAEISLIVGKTGEAVTALAPTGYVVIEGRRYEAFCRSGFVDKGGAVSAIGVDNFRLIVSKNT